MYQRKIGIVGIEIKTPNLDEMKNFYSFIFDTTPTESNGVIFFENIGVCLIKVNNVIFQKEKAISILFYTKDVSKMYNHLIKSRFSSQIAPSKHQDSVNSLHIRDIDGNDVIFIENN